MLAKKLEADDDLQEEILAKYSRIMQDTRLLVHVMSVRRTTCCILLWYMT